MIISIDAEKPFDKIQYPFVIFKRKPSVKWALREATSSFKKAIYNKPAANMTLDGEKMKTFSPKTRNKTKMSTLTIIQK